MKKIIKSNETIVKPGEGLVWTAIPEHVSLYHKEIVTAEEADRMGVRLSSVLWEKIEVGGGVLPHYHNVAEVIHITVGKVRLLCNGEWMSCQAGDTFHVPAGVIHSVMNDDSKPTEQVSIFLPAEADVPANRFFETTKVDVPVTQLTKAALAAMEQAKAAGEKGE